MVGGRYKRKSKTASAAKAGDDKDKDGLRHG
jgi:hypothetical protein